MSQWFINAKLLRSGTLFASETHRNSHSCTEVNAESQRAPDPCHLPLTEFSHFPEYPPAPEQMRSLLIRGSQRCVQRLPLRYQRSMDCIAGLFQGVCEASVG